MRAAARRWFGAEPAVHLALAPDGGAVSWQSEREPGLFVWRPGEGVRRLPLGRVPVVDHAWWPAGGAVLAVLGGHRPRVVVHDEATGRTVDVTPEGAGDVHVVDRDQPRLGSLLLAGGGADGRRVWHLLSTRTGPARRVPGPGGMSRLFSDPDDRPRAATARDADGTLVVYAADARSGADRAEGGDAGGWREVWRSRPPGALVTHPIDVTADGHGLYLSAPCRGGFLGVRLLDLRDGTVRTVLDDGEHDLDVVLHPVTRVPQLALVSGARQSHRAPDPELAADLAALTARHPGELQLAGLTRDNATWLVRLDDGRTPPRHLLWDRRTAAAHHVPADRREHGPARLAATAGRLLQATLRRPDARPHLTPTATVTIPARDGLPLDGYLVTPSRAVAPPYPTVLLVHGGPWSRDTWGLSPEAQWLAECGYASLRVNFRGSEGYGTRFLDLGRADWGGGMHDDLEDALRWAVAEGHTDPARVAVMGQSYGGYAALMAATARPKAFALAVAVCAPTDLVAFLRHVKESAHHERAHFLDRVGDPDRDADRLRERSPLAHAARCHTPVLLAHGRDDPLVPWTHATTMAAALAEHGHPHHCLVLSGEGHGITRPANRIRLARVVSRQLAFHLAERRT
ncbi:dipeptidyl aminopeptidase/acylaminoacyl peptidase [Nonomuraea muscovyensis]|uniref:Dipeptidyl aminopeptidase/acylaminoacyl peptidase n=1 Tax=Nonomuraea muscovyensis TaxID=1124761 RepID=A0A7X0EXA9_9ACTN|nr:alpha/beta fold hydrolase [Nonomuraea muscovyensis]MBB6347403.1 dipeptidyl aminopeptidase/acylaminoacyl peptidase [Nonomuraea muscovyensis]